MPGEASIYDAHVEELMDLTEEVNGCQLIVLRIVADGVVDGSERDEIVSAFGGLSGASRRALVAAEHIAAAVRLVRSLFYSGISHWVKRIARETDRDLERMPEVAA